MTYIDVAYRYRLSSMVCWSVTEVSPANMVELIKMLFGLRTCVGPQKPCIRRVQIPHGKKQF